MFGGLQKLFGRSSRSKRAPRETADPGHKPGDDEGPAGAGVGAKLPRPVPSLAGGNAKPFPPPEE